MHKNTLEGLKMVYNIYICDDEPQTCSQIEEILHTYSISNGIGIDTEVFITGEELFSYVRDHKDVDLVFLDIELPGLNGAEIGNMLREKLNNNYVQIVYISSKSTYAMQLFNARPFDFLVKPISRDRLITLFEKFIRIYGKKDSYYEYKYGKKDNKILLSRILYICSNNKQINIVTSDEIYSHYGSIRSIHGKYDKDGFWSVHNSYIVNIKYADRIRDDEIVMCNGDRIPVSRGYRSELKRRLLNLNEVV